MMDKLREKMAAMGKTTQTFEPKPAALAAIPEDRVVAIDVREDLRNGKEPFSQIMAARQQMVPGGALSVRAIFEPAPLYAVLGRQGLAHWTEKLADDDWRVWFWPEAQETAAAAPADESGTEGDVVVLDVRGLEPPEPMLRTLAALETLPAGKTLVQINVRTPQFLLPMLAERGFTWEVREQGDELVRVFIRKEQ